MEIFLDNLLFNSPSFECINTSVHYSSPEIIGVVADFNYTSLHTKVAPMLLVMNPMIPLSGSENINIDNNPVPKLMIRFLPGNMAIALERVKTIWNDLAGNEEFAFTFVDQSLAEQYRSDLQLGKIVVLQRYLP